MESTSRHRNEEGAFTLHEMTNPSQLERIAARDPALQQLPRVVYAGTAWDHSHAQRRAQQRCISPTKIRIALAYGKQERHHAMERWTVLRSSLRRSPYIRHGHELEGLQLVGWFSPGDGILQLKTCKWVWRLRTH